jgi:quinol monooxygenase YgiN
MPDAKTYIHAATSLQLRSWRFLFGFLRLSNQVQGRLRETPGYVKYALRASLFRLTFRTYSIYESHEALQELIYSPEHAAAMAKMGEWSGPESRTTHWTSASAEIDWADAQRRLAETPTFLERQARGRAGVQISK